MRAVLAVSLAALSLAACQEERLPEIDPARFDAAREACLEDGGRWVARAETGGMICLRTPRDAGRACSSSADCETQCLARSRTCAPVDPLYGCHEVLGAGGAVSTVCLQ